ncbi:histidine kinase [Fusarium heterosporum]|uniref:Histidine kinase n=1 Tax=Fusarium heterosporum TaxID=42747 RepID=A0A8H5WNC3_FUSHE|nr:histidine kinase [Fusarium heterosporum]
MKVLTKHLRRLIRVIWGGQINDLWKQVIKCSIASTAAIITVITPQAVQAFGSANFLAPMATVFAHPGQRLGPMIESLLMLLLGSLLGLGWSILGVFLSSLVLEENPLAAFAIRGVFLVIACMLHGYIRSASPRVFLFVAFFLISCLIVLLGSTSQVSLRLFTNVYYPILVGSAISLVVNLSMFPELSSSYLGISTIDALCETMDTLTRATHWFVTHGSGCPDELDKITLTMTDTLPIQPKQKKGRVRKWVEGHFPNPFKPSQNRYLASTEPVGLTSISSLTTKKDKLRARLTRCKAAQREVNYELSISALPPSSLKPFSTSQMGNLVQNAITIIGACENKHLVLDDANNYEDDDLSSSGRSVYENSEIKRMNTFDDYLQKVEQAKPVREIEASSANFLESIIERIRDPVREFEASMKEAVRLAIVCVAYCYDVPWLPSGAPAPKGIHLQELDFRIDLFSEAIVNFDSNCAMELRRSAMDKSGHSIDFMPRLETFLISSFVLGLRQSAKHVLEMLKHVRKTVEQRQARHNRASVWFPKHISIQQWLTSGGENDGFVLPEMARKQARRGKAPPGSKPKSHTRRVSKDGKHILSEAKDEEKGIRFAEPEPQAEQKCDTEKSQEARVSETKTTSRLLKVRGKVADILEWVQDADDLGYACKLTLAVLIVSWPGLAHFSNEWYSSVKGVWAPMQLFLVFEVAIGTSFQVFLVRLIGVVLGCSIGLLSLIIGNGSKVAMVFILLLGIVPSFYVQLGTKFVKAGMVATVSMVVVALAARDGYNSAVENFYKRLTAFIIGGTIALIVELIIYPVRARSRLVESMAASVKQVENMQYAMAVGLDSPIKPDFRDSGLHKRFTHASNKARVALAAAEAFLPFCSSEPRVKGSFRPFMPIYKEMIYVLHQIIDRMNTAVLLRKEYGSSVLEDLNPHVHAYRRNVASSITLTLFSVSEALTLGEPLPQFLPSTRLAQLRLINHVRQVVASRSGTQTPAGGPPSIFDENGELAEQVAHLITQKRSLSWNASTSGQLEIIEYLEELVTLTKLLVGVNGFRSGLLEMPTHSSYQHTRANRIPLSRMPTAESNTTGVPAEEVPTVPSTFAPVESRTSGLRRTQTLHRASHGGGRFDKRENEKEVGSDSEEDIPVSLQRVGSRLCDNNTMIRRRTITISRDNR